MAVGSGKPGVVGKERCAESLGERDVRGIVGREIGTKLPNARNQKIVRISIQGQIAKVFQSFLSTLSGQDLIPHVAPKHLDNF